MKEIVNLSDTGALARLISSGGVSGEIETHAQFRLEPQPISANTLRMRIRLRPKILTAALLLGFFAPGSPCQAEQPAFIPEKFKGIILYAPEPEFAEGYRKNNTDVLQGVYRLTINQKTGAVDEVGVLKRSGMQKLDGVSVMTLFKWKFRPGSIRQLDIPVTFESHVVLLLKNAASR